MKKLLIIVLILNLFGCSAEKLYDIAIDYERGRAELDVKYLTLDIGKIAYLENNKKSDITTVLLHGFGAEKDIWNRFIAELDSDTHIIALDLLGHGESVSDSNLNYSISNQAMTLDKFLTVKNINKIHVVGNSMGGAIAIRYSDNFPSKVSSLTLVDSMGTKNTKRDLNALISKLGLNKLILNECTEIQFNELLSTGMKQPPYIPGIFMDLLVSIKCSRAKVEKIVFKAILQDTDLTALYSNFKFPTLILWGEDDRIFSVDDAQLFKNGIVGSQLVIFENIGHVPILEAPKKTADAFNAFIINNK